MVFKCLDRVFNDMLKKQRIEIKNLARPITEELAGQMLLQTLNAILARYPLEEPFFPE